MNDKKRDIVIRFFLWIFMMALIGVSCKSSEQTARETEYEVTTKRNVSRVRVVKVLSDENSVEFIIRGGRGQLTSSGPTDLYLQGSSGVEEMSNFRGYNDVTFPFRGRVSFRYIKQKNDVTTASQGETESLASTVDAAVGVELKTPGRWVVTIYY